jgi:ATP-dependent protease ClpP protease subunit
MKYLNKTKRGEAELFLYGDVGFEIDAKDVSEEIRSVRDETDLLRVEIFSAGGSVFDGKVIYDNLRNFPGRVEVDVVGLAASIASVIIMAGDEIRISDGAFVMIHKPFAPVMGDADEMRKVADLLDRLEDTTILDAYARTKIPRTELRTMMRNETWLTAKDAVESKFADRIVDAPEGISARTEVQSVVNRLEEKNRTPLTVLASVKDQLNAPEIEARARRLRRMEMAGV